MKPDSSDYKVQYFRIIKNVNIFEIWSLFLWMENIHSLNKTNDMNKNDHELLVWMSLNINWKNKMYFICENGNKFIKN